MNFTEFAIRFANICTVRAESPLTIRGMSSAQSKSNLSRLHIVKACWPLKFEAYQMCGHFWRFQWTESSRKELPAKSSTISILWSIHCTENISTNPSSSLLRSKSASSRRSLPDSTCSERNKVKSEGNVQARTQIWSLLSCLIYIYIHYARMVTNNICYGLQMHPLSMDIRTKHPKSICTAPCWCQECCWVGEEAQ